MSQWANTLRSAVDAFPELSDAREGDEVEVEHDAGAGPGAGELEELDRQQVLRVNGRFGTTESGQVVVGRQGWASSDRSQSRTGVRGAVVKVESLA